MSVIGIVCEFNPFHNGHKYLIDTVKKDGDIVVCVMSGNYVQRGEPSIFPKEYRIRAALLNGADAVIELPFLFATASAEQFSTGAVTILNAMGCDKIAFGTENTTVSQLEKAVDIMLSSDFDSKIKTYLEKGVSYPTARQMAFDEYTCECDISTSNNILAIEYMTAIKKNNYSITPVAVSRKGAGYNDNFAVDTLASATHVRSLINSGDCFSEYVPQNAYEIYKEAIECGDFLSEDKFNITALSQLRASKNDLSHIGNMAEGLENRIESAIKTSSTLGELYDKVKTKRFTHSRVRRAVLSSIFSVTADDLRLSVPYCRLLGFNEKISIGSLAKQCKLPFVVNYSDLSELNNENAKRVFTLECKSTDLYNLSLQNSRVCGTEMTNPLIKMK